ncbi:MAG: CDP-diacylglycerol--serine O-phosphatidyltransferase [Vicinamibacteria bacterium]|nr:CDP-diacylglycerol--serine O-phosphatidyltransferase [Vicinamibacteria bacterium]
MREETRGLRRVGRFRRGVSLLPTFFTMGNLFLGFRAIVASIEGQHERAAPLILWAILLDILDGRIARMTGTASDFGGELDSLADAISFGVAPAVLFYTWACRPVIPVGWVAAFLFVVCGVMRLARFNVQKHAVDGRHFVGLPIPAAAGQLAVIVLFAPRPLDSLSARLMIVFIMTALSFLMVSTLRYPSFKSVDLRSRRSYVTVLGVALLFPLLALHPEWTLIMAGSLYTLFAPATYLFGQARRRFFPGKRSKTIAIGATSELR